MTEQLSRPAEILRDLIRCPSVTPQEGGALTFLEHELTKLGFCVERITFSDSDTPDVENLYARIGRSAPNVMFAGHTDVVPTGEEKAWSSAPFSGAVVNGEMIGRGAVDMKGGIACFLAAIERVLQKQEIPGSISFLITGDEEGPSINGTDKLLKWCAEKGETWDAAIVGEPSNPNAIGDTIKNGRRGSLSGILTVNGVQGHSAYPHLADNPVRGLIDLLNALLESPFDHGTEHFQPTNLEVTSVDVGNPANNVIPAKATAAFNIRFNDTWTGETLQQEILDRFEKGAKTNRIRKDKEAPLDFSVEWIGRISHVFLTEEENLVGTLSKSVEAITGKTPELSTGGGTSDARFIKDYCPVVEFGLVGQTMHMVDERTPLSDLDTLTAIYQEFLENYFGNLNG
ncbi:MAG: succinyl-diaminopimelate desuccinylase [Pseudomonadota bacterium]